MGDEEDLLSFYNMVTERLGNPAQVNWGGYPPPVLCKRNSLFSLGCKTPGYARSSRSVT